jgi:hypothetical protein
MLTMSQETLDRMREQAENEMKDSCLRMKRPTITAVPGAPAGTDGRGGISKTAGSATGGYVAGETYPCRVQRVKARIGFGEDIINETIREKDDVILVVPWNATIDGGDRVVITYHDGREGETLEILKRVIQTDPITLKYTAQREN